MTDSTRFAFTKVFVDDLSAEASFYCSIFGLKEKARLSLGEGADALEEVILTSERGDDSSLVLWRYLARATPTPGEATVGFNVIDIHSTVKQVTESGGRVVEPPNELPGHGVLYSFVTDPEGHLIEIVQNC